jgi:hypothetical protein
LAERQRRQPSKLERRVQLPQGILGDRLTVGCLPLKQAMEVQILLPEPFSDLEAQIVDDTAGWLLLVATPGSDPGGRWFDSNPRNSTEVIRPDEEPVLKTGGPDDVGIVGSSPTASARRQSTTRAHGPTGRRRSCKPALSNLDRAGAIPGESTFANDTVPSSSGEDSWPTPRQRWFESIRDHFQIAAQVRQWLSGSA